MSSKQDKVSDPEDRNPPDSAEQKATTTEQVRQAAHDAVDTAASKAEELELRARAKSAEVQQKASAGKADAQEQFDEAFDKLEAYIRKKPLTSAGMAFGIGVLATMILRR